MLSLTPFVQYLLLKVQNLVFYNIHITKTETTGTNVDSQPLCALLSPQITIYIVQYTEAQCSAGTNIVSFSFVQYFLPKIQCILYTEVHGKQVLILTLIPVCVTLILFTSQSSQQAATILSPIPLHITDFQGYRTGLVHNCTIFLCSLDVRNMMMIHTEIQR